jgi:hypothetical protein
MLVVPSRSTRRRRGSTFFWRPLSLDEQRAVGQRAQAGRELEPAREDVLGSSVRSPT